VKAHLAIAVASAAALLAALADARAQPGCQPTIMKPCTAPAPRAEVNAADASKSNDAKKTDQVQNTPRRGIPVTPDTTLGLGARGLGINGKF
jgi:hypothetical protein